MKNMFKNPWAKGGEFYKDWTIETKGNNTFDKNSSLTGCSTGTITLVGFKNENFKEIRIIPEDGQPYQPQQNQSFSCDGFYYQNFSDTKYWYKVSGGSSVIVKHIGTSIIATPKISIICKKLAKIAGKYYNVGWEPKSKSHYTENPFDL
jgi:hypothetical protein